MNDENFGEEDNVQDYDDDDWNSEKPIAVTQIHPAMVILECLILLNIYKENGAFERHTLPTNYKRDADSWTE